jgi:hypothetical protein
MTGRAPSGGTEPEFDAPAIDEIDDWASWDHTALQQMVGAIATDPMFTASAALQDAAGRVEDALAEYRTAMSAALGTGSWQGEAARAADDLVRRYVDWGATVVGAVRDVADSITGAAQAAVDTRNHLPPAREPHPMESMLRALAEQQNPYQAPNMYLVDLHDKEAKAEAVQVMNTYLTAGYQNADARMPAIPDPPTLSAVPVRPADLPAPAPAAPVTSDSPATAAAAAVLTGLPMASTVVPGVGTPVEGPAVRTGPLPPPAVPVTMSPPARSAVPGIGAGGRGASGTPPVSGGPITTQNSRDKDDEHHHNKFKIIDEDLFPTGPGAPALGGDALSAASAPERPNDLFRSPRTARSPLGENSSTIMDDD